MSMSMCLSSCTHKADKASHVVLDLRAESVNFAKRAMMGSQGPRSAVSMIFSEKQWSRFRNSATVQNGRSEVIFGLFGVWN